MRSVILASVLCLALATAVFAQTSLLQGTWVLNPSKSNAPNMHESEIMIVEFASDGTERGSYDVVTFDGKKRFTEYEAKPGAGWTKQKDGGHVLVAMFDEWTSVRLAKRPDGTPSMALRVVSKDGKTFTWTGLAMDGKITGMFFFEKK